MGITKRLQFKKNSGETVAVAVLCICETLSPFPSTVCAPCPGVAPVQQKKGWKVKRLESRGKGR